MGIVIIFFSIYIQLKKSHFVSMTCFDLLRTKFNLGYRAFSQVQILGEREWQQTKIEGKVHLQTSLKRQSNKIQTQQIIKH